MSDNTSRLARNKLIGPLISLFTVFLCVISLEVTGYIWEARTAQGPLGWTLVGARRIQLEKHGSTEQPYYKFKSNEQYNWEGIPVQINSRGFRGKEFPSKKPTGVFRILNLGDSVAFGWEVSEEQTYGSRLEEMLNDQKDGLKYEVINLGIPTLNLTAERNLLVQEALTYEPDLVILDITLVNDIYGSGPDLVENPSLFQWLRDNTYGWPFLTNNIRFLMARKMGPEAIPVLNPPTDESQYYPLDINDQVYNELCDIIQETSDATRTTGADLILVIFPTAFQINSANHSNVPQVVLTQHAQSMGIPYVDMLPVYAATCEDAGMEKCEGYENLLFADIWMHPNGLGHRLAAEQLTKIILGLK